MKTTKLNLDAIADAILAGDFDFSKYSDDQIKELVESSKTLKEQNRIDNEYMQDVPVAPFKAEAPAHTLKDASKVVGCDTLLDSAFVISPMGSAHSDDDDEVVVAANAIVDDDDEPIVKKGFRGDPADGMHKVILVDYPNKIAGKNGNSDYRILQLRDTELCNEWTVFISEEQLGQRLQEISYNNKGCLAGMTKKACFGYLMANSIPCWTVKTNKVVTYFDEVAFNKYFRWIQSQKAAKEDSYAQKHSVKVDKDQKAQNWEF